MSRVIHTGDTHVGYRQYHVPERREDFLAAFRQVATDAVEGDVDAVVHAGDLFHDRRPDLPDLLGTLRILRRLDAADIPFLAIVGNHEGKRDAQWLDLFESLGLATRLGAEPTVIGDTAFYGLDFVPRSQRADLAYEFAPNEAAHAALIAHGLFEPFDHADWDTEAVLSASPVSFDALLLGDNHDPGTAQIADAWVTYCGSTERTSADERAERGYNIVEFDGDVRIARRGLETREFVYVDVELGEGEGVERVRERVGQHDLGDAVVVVSIEGAGEPFPPARIEETVREAGALVCRVTDRRAVDVEADVTVSFADPDEAVRERVRELGLSPVARDVEQTVRDRELADANVRDAVAELVEDHLEEPEAVASAEDETTDESAEPPTEEATDGAAADTEPDDPGDGGASGAGVPDETTAVDGGDRPGDGEPTGTPERAATAASDEAGGADGEDQASMEEFL